MHVQSYTIPKFPQKTNCEKNAAHETSKAARTFSDGNIARNANPTKAFHIISRSWRGTHGLENSAHCVRAALPG